MKKVKRITTIQDCIQQLHFICHDFFYTDLLMHKQGVVYDIESYQNKMIKRLKVFFQQVKKVIQKSDKEEIIKTIQEKEDVYFELIEKERNKVIEYSPERITEVEIGVKETMLCERIRAMLAEEKFAAKSLKEILKTEIFLIKKMYPEYRKELYDYGYIPKREKVVKYLK